MDGSTRGKRWPHSGLCSSPLPPIAVAHSRAIGANRRRAPRNAEPHDPEARGLLGRARAGEPQQGAAGPAVRSDGHVVRRSEPRLRRLSLRPAVPRVHRPGEARLRGRPQTLQRGQSVARRDRPVLPGRPAHGHDARLADRDDPAADRDLHGLELQQRVPADLPRRPSVDRPEHGDLHLQRRVAAAAGKATRWSSTRATSRRTTTTSIPASRSPRSSACRSGYGCSRTARCSRSSTS